MVNGVNNNINYPVTSLFNENEVQANLLLNLLKINILDPAPQEPFSGRVVLKLFVKSLRKSEFTELAQDKISELQARLNPHFHEEKILLKEGWSTVFRNETRKTFLNEDVVPERVFVADEVGVVQEMTQEEYEEHVEIVKSTPVENESGSHVTTQSAAVPKQPALKTQNGSSKRESRCSRVAQRESKITKTSRA